MSIYDLEKREGEFCPQCGGVMAELGSSKVDYLVSADGENWFQPLCAPCGGNIVAIPRMATPGQANQEKAL
jgi:hypothetical protein